MSNNKTKPAANGAAKAEGSGSVPSSSELIPHAYALVPVGLGKFRAVHLTNVVAEKVECLEPSGRAEPGTHGLARCETAMMRRYRDGGWVK